MPEANQALVRAAYAAYRQGDVGALLEVIHPDLEWTYLDPSMPNPEPQTCHGRAQLEWALPRQAGQGLVPEAEEIAAHGDKVLVVVHTPGLDQHRAWAGEDRNYLVLTLHEGQVVAMWAFRTRDEARAFTGLPAGGPGAGG